MTTPVLPPLRNPAHPPPSARCVCCDQAATVAGDGPVMALLTVACNHAYCHGCLVQFIRTSIAESVWPTCCSQRIEMGLEVTALLTADERQRLTDADNFLHRENDRHKYCATPRCSARFTTADIAGYVGTCAFCKKKTCLECQGPQHVGPCQLDRATKKTLKLAKRKGWKQCPFCRTLVERTCGCHVMQCRNCYGWFCYHCGHDPCRCGNPGAIGVKLGKA
ncbi:hypothetical protein B0T19DRAFT_396055 [Cercophora scortea]|uniref:RBR-type E3 ubiquitin transferase n=1 Tax=Cercophora scortea TaxID=314031 RepID=A0AAE0J4V7_9PEZI|nr:hypothetical protein B0T19DRAFT_396055 [Cercophora scortea]